MRSQVARLPAIRGGDQPPPSGDLPARRDPSGSPSAFIGVLGGVGTVVVPVRYGHFPAVSRVNVQRALPFNPATSPRESPATFFAGLLLAEARLHASTVAARTLAPLIHASAVVAGASLQAI